MTIHPCEVRLSLIVGNFWFKLNSPDTGIWMFRTKRWMFTSKSGVATPQRRTDWYRLI